MANGVHTIVESNPLDDCHVSFDSFHTGETPKTASSATKFFPIDPNEVLNTPTGIDGVGPAKQTSDSGGLFFADDFHKRLPNLDLITGDAGVSQQSVLKEDLKLSEATDSASREILSLGGEPDLQ
ncbi:uncharacterized protein DEA37_0005664 [Paragonimus westermani]|uniref:Uncharacterized protein n=1 Tax=Paragonimus westermani TaxID=34504 RepID=A0A5J4NGI8_9TREM|nr:uncharacterized protein DEA37_0005664 [Paragonimus westermani]